MLINERMVPYRTLIFSSKESPHTYEVLVLFGLQFSFLSEIILINCNTNISLGIGLKYRFSSYTNFPASKGLEKNLICNVFTEDFS